MRVSQICISTKRCKTSFAYETMMTRQQRLKRWQNKFRIWFIDPNKSSTYSVFLEQRRVKAPTPKDSCFLYYKTLVINNSEAVFLIVCDPPRNEQWAT